MADKDRETKTLQNMFDSRGSMVSVVKCVTFGRKACAPTDPLKTLCRGELRSPLNYISPQFPESQMFAQADLALEVKAIHLWWISLDVTEENLQTFISLLSESEKIKANAEKQKEIIITDAYREAQKIKGQGDAKAARVYSDVFSKNKEFYDFYRSLEAYRNSVNSKEDILVLDPNTEFFKYLQPRLKK